jgi:TldD protein
MNYALKIGERFDVDLVEVRGEDIAHSTIVSEKMNVKDTRVFRRVGIGIRVYKKGATGYSFTTWLSKKSIKMMVQNTVKAAKVAGSFAQLKLKPAQYDPIQCNHALTVKQHPIKVEFEEKKEMLHRGEQAALDQGVDVATTQARYGEAYGRKYFLNSESADISREILLVSMGVTVVSKRGSVLTNASDGHGGSLGLEVFRKEYAPERLGQNAAKWAAEKLEGKKPPAGRFRALLDNKLSGVMAHESFGHLSEYDFVMTGGSPLCGKLNQKLGSEYATIIDEGVINHSVYPGFTLPFDDEGVKTRSVTLLNKGILENYLHLRGTAGAVNVEPTGNGRAVDFRFEPICRMRNTYFTPGDLTVEEGLELLGDGVYVCNTSGGQVGLDGTFLFKAVCGYWVERGERKYTFRDVAIRGHIFDFLQNVIGRCNDLKLYSSYFGGCGKGGQSSLPCGIGGPHLLLKEATFGGEQG